MDFIKSSKVPLWTIGKGSDCSKAGACLQGREGEGLGISAIFTHYFRSTSMRRERSPWCAWHRETWGRFWTFYRWELKVRTVVLQLYFNFPQSCNMAFGKVTEDNVYTCVGEWLSCSHYWTIVFSIFVLLDYPLKVTPFALTSQTSQTGRLMKTSAQHTGNKPIEMIWTSSQNFDISS